MRAIILYCPHLNRDISALQAIPHAEILTGVPTVRGEDGCLEMHKQAIREAMADGDPMLFVMEDDCAFTEHFRYEKWLADAEWAQKQGYDVMAGGCTRTYDARTVFLQREAQLLPSRNGGNDERYALGSLSAMIDVSGFHSAHCVVYFASGYEKALKAIQPYDWSLGRDCGMRCVLTWPFVAVQRPAYSGILRKNVDYLPEYERHEADIAKVVGL